MNQIIDLNPATYQSHQLHTAERDWSETNCYVDIWIELLHAMKFDPLAALPFTLSIDFEDDQWTFFKFPLSDLRELYGLDVQELAVWKPITEHIDEQLAHKKPVIVELDSFFLPDTIGSAYHAEHVKSSVAITTFDLEYQSMEYFHGQGYYQLAGSDFENIFYLNDQENTKRLPPYVEIVKQRKSTIDNTQELVSTSLNLLDKQIQLMPEINPFIAFKKRFELDFEWLRKTDLEKFHQYSFATFRQFGSCYELAANYFGWLESNGVSKFQSVKRSFKSISELSKAYQFQLARAMARNKSLDFSPISKMSEHWQNAHRHLSQHD